MLLLGLDIGGTKCAAVLAETEGDAVRFLYRREIPTVGSAADTLGALASCAEEGAAACGADLSRLAGAGISCGGPLDASRGVVLSPPNLPGWDGVPVAAFVREKFGVPARLMNDADACALAEWRWGAGRGTRHFVFLTFGTGLGAGLILNGALYEGASSDAGELGHIRLSAEGPAGYGKCGSFEGFCSGGGIARAARGVAEAIVQRGGRVAFASDGRTGGITAKSVAEAAFAGDKAAQEIFRGVGHRLGQGLAGLVDLLNPQRIALGGVFMRAEALLREEMENVLRRECLPRALAAVRIVPAQLGEQIGDYGAVTAALAAAENR